MYNLLCYVFIRQGHACGVASLEENPVEINSKCMNYLTYCRTKMVIFKYKFAFLNIKNIRIYKYIFMVFSTIILDTLIIVKSVK